ncbi:hypothetical protein [Streptomyces sp. NBC_01224]|uniref:hypothetical protein n=1 Tax=Streptomyces sp. NBC_01224 TaxID=2903783 RepID=UPI003FA3B0C1
MYVIDTCPGMGHQQLTTMGHARHTGRWITVATGTRHLHACRAQLVYIPAVLQRRAGPGAATRQEADEPAALLERVAGEERHARHGAPHPDACLCHACLPVIPE